MNIVPRTFQTVAVCLGRLELLAQLPQFLLALELSSLENYYRHCDCEKLFHNYSPFHSFYLSATVKIVRHPIDLSLIHSDVRRHKPMLQKNVLL